MPPNAFALIVLVAASFIIPNCVNPKQPSEGGIDDERPDLRETALLFQSGFEDDCRIIHDGKDDDIVGKDKSFSEKNDWVNYLEDSVTDNRTNINYTGGDSTKRFAKIIAEPGRADNKVLWFWLNDSWDASDNQRKGRVQLDFNGMKGSYKELYQTVRVYLHEDINVLKTYPGKINWFSLAEFWNNGWWVRSEKYGFRVTFGIGKQFASDTSLFFILNAENAGQNEVWKAENRKVEVPVAKWFTLDYYIKEGNAHNGRFYVAMTPENGQKIIVYDVKGFTHNTSDPSPDGITQFNPLKFYTSSEIISFVHDKGKTLQVYWDDFKLWKYRRPEP